MLTKPVRQGDILIIPTGKIPDGVSEVPRDQGRLILAYGEATGHAHVLDTPDAVLLAADITEMQERFLQVETEAQLVHDEHDPITIPPGQYIVRRQREYAPERNMWVAD